MNTLITVKDAIGSENDVQFRMAYVNGHTEVAISDDDGDMYFVVDLSNIDDFISAFLMYKNLMQRRRR